MLCDFFSFNSLLLASDRVVGEPLDCERPFCNSAVLLLFAITAV